MSDYGRNVANDDQAHEWAKALRAERALADDAAKVLAMGPGPRRIEAEEWWLARYRKARGR